MYSEYGGRTGANALNSVDEPRYKTVGTINRTRRGQLSVSRQRLSAILACSKVAPP